MYAYAKARAESSTQYKQILCSMQAASVRAYLMAGSVFGVWPMIRHLDLMTDIGNLIQGADMQGLLHLETLKLVHTWTANESVNSAHLNLSGAHSLRQLHIEGWSPSSLSAPPRCHVHAVWRHRAQQGKSREWVLSPCWRSEDISLVFLRADLGTRITCLRDVENLAHFRQAFMRLETLKLCSTGQSFDWVDLDLSHVQTLRGLHIENWSPKTINASAGCKVHAVWSMSGQTKRGDSTWLSSPCWRNPDVNLASLIVEGLDTAVIQADLIHTIMECHIKLECLRIQGKKIGSEKAPFAFPSNYVKSLNSPLMVNITTPKGCWLYWDDAILSSKHLMLQIKGLLHIGISNAQGELQWCTLEGHQWSAYSFGKGSSSEESLQQKLDKALTLASIDYNLDLSSNVAG